MRYLRFGVEMCFQKRKGIIAGILKVLAQEEERKHLVGGTERSLLLEDLGLLIGELLVDLGSLAGLVAVRLGLYGV